MSTKPAVVRIGRVVLDPHSAEAYEVKAADLETLAATQPDHCEMLLALAELTREHAAKIRSDRTAGVN